MWWSHYYCCGIGVMIVATAAAAAVASVTNIADNCPVDDSFASFNTTILVDFLVARAVIESNGAQLNGTAINEAKIIDNFLNQGQLKKLEELVIRTYNYNSKNGTANEDDGNDGQQTTRHCDPYFRQIVGVTSSSTYVQGVAVLTNASLVVPGGMDSYNSIGDTDSNETIVSVVPVGRERERRRKRNLRQLQELPSLLTEPDPSIEELLYLELHMDIVGACRGCTTGLVAASLFDDSPSVIPTTPTQAPSQEQQELEDDRNSNVSNSTTEADSNIDVTAAESDKKLPLLPPPSPAESDKKKPPLQPPNGVRTRPPQVQQVSAGVSLRKGEEDSALCVCPSSENNSTDNSAAAGGVVNGRFVSDFRFLVDEFVVEAQQDEDWDEDILQFVQVGSTNIMQVEDLDCNNEDRVETEFTSLLDNWVITTRLKTRPQSNVNVDSLLSIDVISQLEDTFQVAYNSVARQLCDSQYRSITNVEFVPISVSTVSRFGIVGNIEIYAEIIVQGTCINRRNQNVTDCSQSIFYVDGDGGKRHRDVRSLFQQEHSKPSAYDAPTKTLESISVNAKVAAEHEIALSSPRGEENFDDKGMGVRSQNSFYGDFERRRTTSSTRRTQQLSSRRCFCPINAEKRPPKRGEVNDVFESQAGNILQAALLKQLNESPPSPTTLPSTLPSTLSSPSPSSKASDGRCLDFTYDGQGNFQDLYDFCNAFPNEEDRCCQGTDACFFLYAEVGATIRICRGSCRGDYACDSLWVEGSGSVIEEYACQGVFSCAYVGWGTITIGSGSCTGEFSCDAVGFDATSVTIGSGSCTSEFSCDFVGFYATSVTITGQSCTDSYSCSWVGIFSDSSITIDGGSCTAFFSCDSVGQYSASSIAINGGSCTNDFSCSWVGLYSASSITIDGGSCTGLISCQEVGRDSASSITINDGSCTNDGSCSWVGLDSASSVTINGGSCTGLNSCQDVGLCSASSITIEDGSCTNDDSCLYVGSNYNDNSCLGVGSNSDSSITINGGSCTGFNACQYVGQYSASSITINGGSCTDFISCSGVGLHSASSIAINGGSCTTPFSCESVGQYSASSITINGGSCTAPYSCTSVGETDATDVNIGTSSCTVQDGCSSCGTNVAGPVTIPDNYPSGCPYYSTFNDTLLNFP